MHRLTVCDTQGMLCLQGRLCASDEFCPRLRGLIVSTVEMIWERHAACEQCAH